MISQQPIPQSVAELVMSHGLGVIATLSRLSEEGTAVDAPSQWAWLPGRPAPSARLRWRVAVGVPSRRWVGSHEFSGVGEARDPRSAFFAALGAMLAAMPPEVRPVRLAAEARRLWVPARRSVRRRAR